MGIHRVELQVEFVFGDSSKIEKVSDELALELHVALNHGQRAFGFVRLCLVLLQRIERAHHWGERRAQFVREHGEEIIFRAIGRLDRALLLFDRRFGTAAFGHGRGEGHGCDRQHGRPGLERDQ